MKKVVAIFFLLVIIMCGLVFIVKVQDVKAAPKTITIPDDYPTIQAAVGNATEGDTVFVKKGTYQEFIEIKMPLSLIGEDRSSTIIKGVGDIYGQSPPIITVDAPNVTVSGFTLTYCDNKGLDIKPAAINCIIKDNIITDTDQGVRTYRMYDYGNGLIIYSTDILISGNYIANNSGFGICCSSSNTIISKNTMMFNGAAGLVIDNSLNVTVSYNYIKGNGIPNVDPAEGIVRIYGGIYLRWNGSFYICGNDITGNFGYGIQFGEGTHNSSVYQNNIEHNEVGIKVLNYIASEGLSFGQNNTVYQNNIVNNSKQVVVETSIASVHHTYPNGTDKVFWDNGIVGNYWSDYQARYPNASEIGSTRIGNTPYMIDKNNIDCYPLLRAVSIPLASPSAIISPNSPIPTATIPEFPAWIILPLLAILLMAIGVWLRKHKLS